MTVAAVATETVYALTGATLGPFNTVWPYNAPGDVTVQLDAADGSGPHLLAQGADYTLTASNPTLTNGGSVLLAQHVLTTAAWAAGALVALVRVTPRGQPSSFGEAVGFSPQASEQALDAVERQVQELTTASSRALKAEYGAPGQITPTGPLALWTNDAAGKLASFDYGGAANELIGTDSQGNLKLWAPPNFPPTTTVQGGGVVVATYDDIRESSFSPTEPGGPIALVLADPYKGGVFSPTTTGSLADNGGTRIVDAAGVTWKRQFSGAVNAAWFYNAPTGHLGDGLGTAITAQDQVDNPQWIGLPAALGGGPYPVGTTWAYVALMEAIYTCFASASTPGNVVWNGNAAQMNQPFAAPPGDMVINQSLYLSAAGIDMTFGEKKGGALVWQGSQTASPVMFDAIAYGAIRNLSVIDNAGVTGVPLVDMNWTGANPGLRSQQLTLYDWYLGGSNQADSVGVFISRGGGGAQGDTITFVNPLIVYCTQAMIAGGANALSIIILGGNVQVALKDGFVAYGGSFFLYGPSFEVAAADYHVYPQANQVSLDGADAHIYPGGGATARCTLTDVRSEDMVLSIDRNSASRLQNCGIAQAYGMYGWGPGAHQHLGMLASTGGLINPVVMAVDDSGPAWFPADASSTNTKIVKQGASPNWAVNAWVGFVRWFRYGNGYAFAGGPITASDANSVTDPNGFYSPEPFPGFTPGQLAGYLVKVMGVTGQTEPAWDTYPPGQMTPPNATGWGFTTSPGSNVVSGASVPGNGQWVVVCDALRIEAPPQSGSICPGPLIGKVQNFNPGASFTASLAVNGVLTVSAVASGTIKIGAALGGGWGGTVITGQTSGAAGVAGTYTVSNPTQPAIASEAMTTAAAGELVNSLGEPQNATQAIVDGMGYYGAGIPDGQITWLPIDFDVIAGAASVDNVAPGAYGKLRSLGVANFAWSMTNMARVRPGGGVGNFGYRTGSSIAQALMASVASTNPTNIAVSQIANQGHAAIGNALAAFTLNMPLWLDNVVQDYRLVISNGGAAAVLTWGTHVKAAAPTVNLGVNLTTIVTLTWVGSPAGAGTWFVTNVQGPM